MAGGAEFQTSILGQPGTDAADGVRKLRLGLQDIELRGRCDCPLQILTARTERVGQLQQDAPYFFRLLLLEGDDVVVDLDRAQRLEKQTRAAARAAVHDSR